MSQVSLIHASLDGRPIAFSTETEFKVQVASPKGKWRTRWSFRGNLGRAVLFYNSVNLGYGWRKRLVAPGFNKPVLARAVS